MTSASIYNVPANAAVVSTNHSTVSEAKGQEFVKAMSKSLSFQQTQNGVQTEVSAAKEKDLKESLNTAKTEERDTFKFEKKSEQIKEVSHEESKETAETAVSKFDDEVRAELKKKLGVSDEEIDAALEALGLQMQDLMQPQNLTMFVSELTGNTDSMSILLDENITSLITGINDFVQELTSETGLSISEMQMLSQENIEMADLEGVHVDMTQGSTQMELEELPEELPEELQDKISNFSTEVDTAEESGMHSGVKTVEADVKERESTVYTAEDAKGMVQTEITSESDISGNQGGFHQNSQEDAQKEGMLQQTAQDSVPMAETNVNSTTTFSQTVVQAEVTTSTSYTSQIDVQRMMTDIVEQAKVTLTEEVKTMEMVLNPEHLGKLFMEVSNKDGQINARIYTENEAVKNALENQLVTLKENMNQQGLKIDAVEVSVATHEFEKNLEENASDQERRDAENAMQQEQEKQSNRGVGNIDLNQMDQLQGLMTEEEQLVAKIMRENGNTVNYMA